MALEIERKFLVENSDWREIAYASQHFAQGYLNDRGRASVRVRIEGETANMNIKAARIGNARAEYEYPIPLSEAREILDDLTLTPPVKKTRHWVEYAGHTWEIDVFEGVNAPLVVAEIELEDPEAHFERPSWLGAEITHDQRYYNHALAFAPYSQWPDENSALNIEIDLGSQELRLNNGTGELIKRYWVATSARGPGECEGSYCTPRGEHVIRAKIGAGCPDNTVFVGRRPTGERFSADLARTQPDRDWILARILWVSGTEVGRNRLGKVDTMRRYVYIHGTPDNVPMGQPSSHGCIRMRRPDVVELFEQVAIGTRVTIHE